MTALHTACENEIKCVKVLLEYPASVDIINSGKSFTSFYYFKDKKSHFYIFYVGGYFLSFQM